MGPGNQVLFSRKGKQEGVFYFTPNNTGSFQFTFNNKKVLQNWIFTQSIQNSGLEINKSHLLYIQEKLWVKN